MHHVLLVYGNGATSTPDLMPGSLRRGEVGWVRRAGEASHCKHHHLTVPVTHIVVTSVQYKLESFVEYRTTKWAFEPYTGQPITTGGHPPQPWEVPVKPKEMFKEGKEKTEVPNTASIKPCHSCFAIGFKRCRHCFGRGMIMCSPCHGRGMKQRPGVDGEMESCVFCHGAGRKNCTFCHGRGQSICNVCQGRANLKCYVKLKVEWKNKDTDYVKEDTPIPKDLIKNVSGVTALSETYPLVWPISHFKEEEINKASARIVQEHRTKFPDGRIMMQRHEVRIVPVTKCDYTWKDKDLCFFVYGTDNKVYHGDDYPAQCCCCTIM